MPGYPDSARIVCANGHLGMLDHSIDDDGTVKPSVVCMEEGCNFHEWIQLVGWGTRWE